MELSASRVHGSSVQTVSLRHSFLESMWKLFYCGLGGVLNLHSCFLFVTAVSGRKFNKKLLTKKNNEDSNLRLQQWIEYYEMKEYVARYPDAYFVT